MSRTLNKRLFIYFVMEDNLKICKISLFIFVILNWYT